MLFEIVTAKRQVDILEVDKNDLCMLIISEELRYQTSSFVSFWEEMN